MTIVVLDSGTGLPYGRWLGADVTVVSGRGARADWAVLELGRRVSAVVALDPADLVRAAALRETLGVPGMGRADATALTDLVVLRERLRDAGIPTPACGAVCRAYDIFDFAERYPAPYRLRSRRRPWWPPLDDIEDAAQLRTAVRHTLTAGQELMRSLVIERRTAGVRERVTDVPAEVLAAAGWPDGWPVAMEVTAPPGGGPPLVEGLGVPEGLSHGAYREWASRQAGVPTGVPA